MKDRLCLRIGLSHMRAVSVVGQMVTMHETDKINERLSSVLVEIIHCISSRGNYPLYMTLPV